jgi:hypothetical protein
MQSHKKQVKREAFTRSELNHVFMSSLMKDDDL